MEVEDDREVGESGKDAADFEADVCGHWLGDLRLLLQRGLVLDCAPATWDHHEEAEQCEGVEY